MNLRKSLPEDGEGGWSNVRYFMGEIFLVRLHADEIINDVMSAVTAASSSYFLMLISAEICCP
jgi:hypothetical protein